MNTQIKNEETNVLVMFPSSKNFPIEETLTETIIETIPDFYDERFDNDEIEILEDDIYPSLEAFMNRHQRDVALTPDERLALKIEEQIKAITEAKERIKFYLDELNIFMPLK